MSPGFCYSTSVETSLILFKFTWNSWTLKTNFKFYLVEEASLTNIHILPPKLSLPNLQLFLALSVFKCYIFICELPSVAWTLSHLSFQTKTLFLMLAVVWTELLNIVHHDYECHQPILQLVFMNRWHYPEFLDNSILFHSVLWFRRILTSHSYSKHIILRKYQTFLWKLCCLSCIHLSTTAVY